MACCDNCGNFDDSYNDESSFNQEWKDARKEFDENYQPDLYYYWKGDIEEDYDMGEYTCLCEICFDINNSEGKIAWKDDKNPFECTSLISGT